MSTFIIFNRSRTSLKFICPSLFLSAFLNQSQIHLETAFKGKPKCLVWFTKIEYLSTDFRVMFKSWELRAQTRGLDFKPSIAIGLKLWETGTCPPCINHVPQHGVKAGKWFRCAAGVFKCPLMPFSLPETLCDREWNDRQADKVWQ